eukprot:gnl/TRDRNA2_/TRDRNA2_174217_c6_seq1.p2 gnl/TRDRNA2_/TRDRNA2_174217_c6~~gnl/TRDRNA2_/TRDRNA2_174217_c6_seq1.p2  ORF type:complete len:115 (+),score=12.43 gnl/TRDRNA2_/TRDRNA2_174217_c6_seq1:268-612(+)
MLAIEAELRLSKFKMQELVCIAWAFATGNQWDEKALTALTDARSLFEKIQHAEHCFSATCVGAISTDCEWRVLRDGEIAPLRGLEGIMCGYDSVIDFGAVAKSTLAARLTTRSK